MTRAWSLVVLAVILVAWAAIFSTTFVTPSGRSGGADVSPTYPSALGLFETVAAIVAVFSVRLAVRLRARRRGGWLFFLALAAVCVLFIFWTATLVLN